MNLEQLIEQFRVDSDDMQSPPLWESEWIAAWLTEAQDLPRQSIWQHLGARRGQVGDA